MSMNNCPCGSGLMLETCCGQYFENLAAPTAEALMRTRYSAHVLGKARYLSDTLSVAQRADFDIAETERMFGQTKWLELEIRKTTDGGESDQTGTVEFVARCRDKKWPRHSPRAFFLYPRGWPLGVRRLCHEPEGGNPPGGKSRPQRPLPLRIREETKPLPAKAGRFDVATDLKSVFSTSACPACK